MPIVLASLLGGLINIAGSMAGRVLIALGISVVTYTGVSASLGWLKTQALQAFTGAGGDLVGLLAYMKVGVCISIVTSAITARAAISGLTSDTFKRWVIR